MVSQCDFFYIEGVMSYRYNLFLKCPKHLLLVNNIFFIFLNFFLKIVVTVNTNLLTNVSNYLEYRPSLEMDSFHNILLLYFCLLNIVYLY